jgi:hypothetical protein
MTRNFGKNTWKPGKENKYGAILIPIETGQGLIRDDIDEYCHTMVVEILLTMTVIDDCIFSINFIHTFTFSLLLINDFFLFLVLSLMLF